MPIQINLAHRHFLIEMVPHPFIILSVAKDQEMIMLIECLNKHCVYYAGCICLAILLRDLWPLTESYPVEVYSRIIPLTTGAICQSAASRL